MKKHDAVNKLIVHIEISAIMTLFLKMVTIVETQEKKLELTKVCSFQCFILFLQMDCMILFINDKILLHIFSLINIFIIV